MTSPWLKKAKGNKYKLRESYYSQSAIMNFET